MKEDCPEYIARGFAHIPVRNLFFALWGMIDLRKRITGESLQRKASAENKFGRLTADCPR